MPTTGAAAVRTTRGNKKIREVSVHLNHLNNIYVIIKLITKAFCPFNSRPKSMIVGQGL